MLLAADVEIYGHVFLHEAGVERAAVEGGVEVAQEVPRRVDERVHRVRLARRAAAAVRVVTQLHTVTVPATSQRRWRTCCNKP